MVSFVFLAIQIRSFLWKRSLLSFNLLYVSALTDIMCVHVTAPKLRQAEDEDTAEGKTTISWKY